MAREVRLEWCAELERCDEHAYGRFDFRPQDAGRLRRWLSSDLLDQHCLVPADHPARAGEKWLEHDLDLVDRHTYAKLTTGQFPWIASQVSLTGSRLEIARNLSASGVSCRGETLLLCELAADPHLQVVDWALGAAGHSQRVLRSGRDSESLLRFLLREQAAL